LKTTIGIPLSMHKEAAVESMTPRPFSITSRYVQAFELLGIGIGQGISVIHSVYPLCHQQDLSFNLGGAESSCGVSRKIRVACPACKDYYSSFFQMTNSPSSDIGFGDLPHLYRCFEPVYHIRVSPDNPGGIRRLLL